MIAHTESQRQQRNCMREIREGLSLDLPSMAKLLNIPYNTYRCYEYGHRPAPADVIAKAREVEQRNRQWFAEWKLRMEEAIDRQYPQGILSEIDPEFMD